MEKFYVYEHWRPDKNVCFYVGKGRGNRAWIVRRPGNPRHSRIAKKLIDLGLAIEIRIVAEGILESAAHALEKELICKWRACGGELANMTDGGEGSCGLVASAETRAKMSLKRRGRKDPDHIREVKRLAALRRVPQADEVRERIRAKVKDLWADNVYRNGMTESHKSYKFTEEHRASLKAGQATRAPRTKEHCDRIAESLRRAHAERKSSWVGKKRTPEQVARMSEAQRKRRAERRAQESLGV